MDWFEENYMFREQNNFQIIFGKKWDNVLLIWKKGDADLNRQMSSDDLDRFLENGMAMPQFRLKREREKKKYCRFSIC